MEWISVQNLIGCMALGFEDIFGKPKAIITNGIANDKQYIVYCEKRSLNVPVCTARFIAKNCKDYFDGKLEISATNILRQSNITHEINSI